MGARRVAKEARAHVDARPAIDLLTHHQAGQLGRDTPVGCAPEVRQACRQQRSQQMRSSRFVSRFSSDDLDTHRSYAKQLRRASDDDDRRSDYCDYSYDDYE